MLRTIRLSLLVSLWSSQAQQSSKRLYTPVNRQANVVTSPSLENVLSNTSSSSSVRLPLGQLATCQQLQLIMDEHSRSRSSAAKKKMEVESWCLLQETPADLSGLDLRGHATIFGAIAYFARFWERGLEGPHENTIEQYRAAESTTNTRRACKVSSAETRLSTSTDDIPRRSPLDEVLE